MFSGTRWALRAPECGMAAAAMAPIIALALLLVPAFPIEAQLPATLEVRVLALPSGEPMAGVRVEASGTGIVVPRTDARGMATLRGLPPGPHQISITHPGFRVTTAAARVETGRTTRIEVLLHPDPLRLESIEVQGERTGRTLPGASVLDPASAPPGARTVADLLALAPGVTLVRSGGPGAPVTASIRGSRAGQLLVLMDGLPVGGGGVGGEVDLGGIALDGVARITVLPGARSSRYGAGALAGVIAIETAAGRTPALGIEGGAGAFGERRIGVSGGGSRGPWTLEGRLRREEARGDFPHPLPDFRGGGTALRANAGFQGTRAEVGLTRHAPLHRLRLRIHGDRTERGSPGTVVQPSLTGSQWQERGGVHAFLEGDRPLDEARVLGGRVDGGFTLHRSEHSDPSPPLGAAWHATSDVREADLRAEASLSTSRARFAFGAGVRERRIEASTLGTGAPGRVREGGLWLEVEGWPSGGPSKGERSLPGFRPRASGGLRADAHDLVRGLTLSPSLTGELARGGTRLTLGWASAFAPPALADLFFQEGVLVRPNPGLAPERVRGEWSLGLEQAGSTAPFRRGSVQGDRLRGEFRLDAFRGTVDGMILWFPDHRFIWSPTNFDVRRAGVGMAAEVGWIRNAERSPGASEVEALTLRGRLEHTRVTYAGGVLSGQMVYRPSWQGRLDLTLAPGAPTPAGLVLRGALEAVGPRRTVHGSDLNTLDPFTTLELGASLPFRLGSWQGEGEAVLRNALDTPAAFLADYPLPGRAWGVNLRLERSR